MEFEPSPHFERAFKKLPEEIKAKISEALGTFCSAPYNCPSEFQDKKMGNQKIIKNHCGSIRCFRPCKDYRVIYERMSEKIIFHLVDQRKNIYR